MLGKLFYSASALDIITKFSCSSIKRNTKEILSTIKGSHITYGLTPTSSQNYGETAVELYATEQSRKEVV